MRPERGHVSRLSLQVLGKFEEARVLSRDAFEGDTGVSFRAEATDHPTQVRLAYFLGRGFELFGVLITFRSTDTYFSSFNCFSLSRFVYSSTLRAH